MYILHVRFNIAGREPMVGIVRTATLTSLHTSPLAGCSYVVNSWSQGGEFSYARHFMEDAAVAHSRAHWLR